LTGEGHFEGQLGVHHVTQYPHHNVLQHAASQLQRGDTLLQAASGGGEQWGGATWAWICPAAGVAAAGGGAAAAAAIAVAYEHVAQVPCNQGSSIQSTGKHSARKEPDERKQGVANYFDGVLFALNVTQPTTLR
jgi:hypothetical protein